MGNFAQRFDANGGPVGSEFQVNTLTNSTQLYSKVQGLDDGGFVIAWESVAINGRSHIHGQRYDANGDAVGEEFLISVDEELSWLNTEFRVAITERDDGALVVTWKNGQFNTIEQKVIASDADVTFISEVDFDFDEVVNDTDGTQERPDVDALADGGHVVVWMANSGNNPDNSGYGVYAQRYDANGEKLGDSILVNAGQIANSQQLPSVAALDTGGFVVTWDDSGVSDGNGWGVFATRFDANGDQVGNHIQVNSTTVNHQNESSVTALENGQFAVTWQSANQTNNGTWEVVLRVFNADGTPATSEIVVNQTTNGSQYSRGWVADSITTLADGRVMVTWGDSASTDGSGWGVFGRIFNADGTADTDEFQINTTTPGSQDYGSVAALDDGGFVVTWSDGSSNDGSGWGVFAQRFDANGDPVGDEFLVNTLTNNTQQYSKVQGLNDGGFVIVWQSATLNGYYNIHGQRYNAEGAAIGGEFLINQSTAFQHNYYPSITERDDGSLVAVWRNGSTNQIMQQVIELDAGAVVSASLVEPSDADPVANAALMTTSGTLGFSDSDLSDAAHSADVTGVTVVSGDDGGLDNATLLALMEATGTGTTNADTAGTLDWTFEASGDLFDYLGTGESLRLRYTLEISDGTSSDQAEVTITIIGRDEDPALTAEEDGAPVPFDLTSLSYNLIGDPADFAYTVVGAPSEGNASVAGTVLTFDPDVDFQSLDTGEEREVTVRVRATNLLGDSVEKDVVVIVTGQNDAPVAASLTASVDEDSFVFVDLTQGATDADIEALSIEDITLTSSGGGGTVTETSATTMRFDATGFDSLAAGETEVVTFSFTLNDGTDVSGAETLSITITGVNDGPVGATTQSVSVLQGGSVALDPLDGMSDPEGEALSVTGSAGAYTAGSIVFDGATNSYSYVADAAFNNLKAGDSYTDVIWFTIEDAEGASATRFVNVEIQGSDDTRVFDFETPDLGGTGSSSDFPATPYNFDGYIFAGVGILDTDAFSGPESNAANSPSQAGYTFSSATITEQNGFEFILDEVYVTGVHEDGISGSDGVVRGVGDAGASYDFIGYKDGVEVASLTYDSTVGVTEHLEFGADFNDIDRLRIIRDTDADVGFVLAFDDFSFIG